MSKDKDVKERSGKKSPLKNLKEKRAAKAAKREGRDTENFVDFNAILGGRRT
jgi:hypothetical protein